MGKYPAFSSLNFGPDEIKLLIRAEFQAPKINYPLLEMGVPLGPTHSSSESSEQEYFYSRITKQTKGSMTLPPTQY